MKLTELVPGSKSDRLSFVSDESLTMDVYSDPERPTEASAPHRVGRGATPRGVTPNRPLEARTRSRENTAKKIAGGSLPTSWSSVDMSDKAETPDGSAQNCPSVLYNCIRQLCGSLVKCFESKIRMLNPFTPISGGILDLMHDPFCHRRVVSKQGKINTHRGSQQRDLSV